MSENFVLVPGTLPVGYCVESWQDLINRAFSGAYGVFPDGLSAFVFGSTEPSVDQRSLPWIRVDAQNGFDRLYTYKNGFWVSPHPVPASSSMRHIWVGSLPDLATYEGGSATTVGDATGPFWEEDTAFQAKFPVGVGTFAASGAVAVLGTGGEDKHVLTETELPSAVSFTQTTNDFVSGETPTGTRRLLSDEQFSGGTVDVQTDATVLGGDNGHNTLPPYIGIYVVKRTARKYYTPV